MLFRAKDIVHIEARDINVKKYKKCKYNAIITNALTFIRLA